MISLFGLGSCTVHCVYTIQFNLSIRREKLTKKLTKMYSLNHSILVIQ